MDMQKTSQAGAWIRHPAPAIISGSTSFTVVVLQRQRCAFQPAPE